MVQFSKGGKTMAFHGIHHIGLPVTDMDRSLRFYTEGLGGKVVHSFPMGGGALIYLVDLGENAVVELIPNGSNKEEVGARWAHVAVATTDARGAFDLAIKAGAVCRSDPQDVNLGTMPVCNAFVFGPDREVIEFFQVKE
jgi:catechol 2,3-dioxygenase-like lactoylglutathione lyase family enzyme